MAPGNVLANTREMRPYECDAVTMYRQMPMVVVLPETVAEVSRIMALAKAMNVKVVPRGGGTSLSGGSLPLEDGILLAMGKFNKILEVDYANRCAVVQPGVANLAISKAVEDEGFYYAPDPSSQIACSIGGNVAENSGGIHCLKYGLTTNNILGIEMVLIGGEVVRLGGKHLDSEALDLLGVMTGSEGLLGVVTEVTVRILKKPSVARGLLLGFPTVEAGCDCVADIIASGIIPGGMEMMDNKTIVATEDFQPCGYPRDAGSLVICELDGTASEVDHLIDKVSALATKHRATTIKVSTSDEERQQFWQGRKNAFPAVGAIGPDYLCMDGTIPRNKLAYVLRAHGRIGRGPRPARRQRVPRRRRQPAPADPLRRCRGRRHRARRSLRRRHPAPLRRGRRLPHRRARRRRREARPHGRAVHRDRPEAAAAGEMRLRPRAPAQPRQDVPAAAPLRRTGQDARAPGAGGLPGAAAVLRSRADVTCHCPPSARRRT